MAADMGSPAIQPTIPSSTLPALGPPTVTSSASSTRAQTVTSKHGVHHRPTSSPGARSRFTFAPGLPFVLQALQRRRQVRLSRLQLCPVWYPGKGRALLAPRSSGTFFKSRTQAKCAWWAMPQQCCPAEVLRWVTHGVKIDFAKKMEPLHLAPRLIPADKIPFVMKDQVKGYAAGAYVDLVPGGEQFLSRSRVHSTTSKDRMVHALLDLNDCTVKKPCTYEQVMKRRKCMVCPKWLFRSPRHFLWPPPPRPLERKSNRVGWNLQGLGVAAQGGGDARNRYGGLTICPRPRPLSLGYVGVVTGIATSAAGTLGRGCS